MNKSLFFLVLSVCVLPSHAVIIGDKNWRQLLDTSGQSFTYDQLTINNVCDAISGKCDSVFNSVDFTGWTWATNTDVAELFYGLNIISDGYFDTNSTFAEANSTWADELIHTEIDPNDTGLFSDTEAWATGADYSSVLSGITRAGIPSTNLAYVANVQDIGTGGGIVKFSPIQTNFSDVSFGVWLYKSVAVPEPDSFLLFGVGLAGLGFVRRRANKRYKKKIYCDTHL